MSLSQVNNGSTVRVRSIESSSLKVRLMEMGLVQDKKIKVLFRAPLGDPMAVEVDGYVLSLRMDEAALVNVEMDQAD